MSETQAPQVTQVLMVSYNTDWATCLKHLIRVDGYNNDKPYLTFQLYSFMFHTGS